MEIIGTIIFGAVIGVLARIVLPGKQPYGFIVTICSGLPVHSSGTGSGAFSAEATRLESTGSAG
jgi:uncharacterized membrane protein YeaQ/YmgE (transglycosylase-associated protein family)